MEGNCLVRTIVYQADVNEHESTVNNNDDTTSIIPIQLDVETEFPPTTIPTELFEEWFGDESQDEFLGFDNGSAVWQPKVKKNNDFYIGLCEPIFKSRYGTHKTSFNHPSHRDETELSKHVWKLKEKGIRHTIKFSVLLQCAPRRAGANTCNLCLWEKLFIMEAGEGALNQRDELLSKCRHINKFLLNNTKK